MMIRSLVSAVAFAALAACSSDAMRDIRDLFQPAKGEATFTTGLKQYENDEYGRGGMGVVYKAPDSVLQRTVAVKTVNMARESTGIGNYEARFYQKARAAGSLSHAIIVTVYDVGKAGDIAYMAMEFIEGVELRTMIGEGRSLPVA